MREKGLNRRRKRKLEEFIFKLVDPDIIFARLDQLQQYFRKKVGESRDRALGDSQGHGGRIDSSPMPCGGNGTATSAGIAVENPATGETIATVPELSVDEVRGMVARARAAQPAAAQARPKSAWFSFAEPAPWTITIPGQGGCESGSHSR